MIRNWRFRKSWYGFFPLIRVLFIFKWWVTSKVPFVPFYSPFPFLMASFVMSLFVLILRYLNLGIGSSYLFFFLFGLVVLRSWKLDLFKESLVGRFNSKILITFRIGFLLMIISEILLFVSFFWAYFNFLGTIRIPCSIHFSGLPVLNTFLLLSRGFTITLYHRYLFQGKKGIQYLIYTLFLGVFFEGCQIFEYRRRLLSLFSFTYGTVFFMLTGLHGFHVFVGILGLCILWQFSYYSYINSDTLVRSECLIWYWHFVDIVWLFVYFFLYVSISFFGFKQNSYFCYRLFYASKK